MSAQAAQIYDAKGMPIITAAMVEELTQGKHPQLERQLVQLAREGGLKGVVKKPPRYSATTIQNHADCSRKFYWAYVAGLDEAPSPQQAFGTELHRQAELWLKNGTTPLTHTKEGQLLNIGLPLLPAPKAKGLGVEEPFNVRFKNVPVNVTGTIDLHRAPQPEAPHLFLLGDHKTARSSRYPKTKNWLSANIQSNLYAKVLADRWRAKGFEITLVDKQWFYYFKEEKHAAKLRVVQDVAEVDEHFDTTIVPGIRNMAKLVAEAPKVTDLPIPDKSVCEAYKGCPHLQRCFGMGAREGNVMGVLAGGFTKSNIANKAAAIRGAGTAVNPPKPRAVPQPEEEEEQEQVEQELEEQEVAEQVPETKPAKAAKKTAAKKPAPVEEEEQQEEQEEAPAPRARKGASRTAPGYNSKHDYWLFVGCQPSKGFSAEPVAIEEIVGSAQASAAKSLGANHYREGNSYGVLETAFASWMEENAVEGAVFVADPTTLVARDVIGLLRAHASVVIGRVQ